VLSDLDANIEALDTRISVEPHSGAPLFPPGRPPAPAAALGRGGGQAALEDISAEIMVDISLTVAKAN
jgi:glycine cleavage system regulatory protein